VNRHPLRIEESRTWSKERSIAVTTDLLLSSTENDLMKPTGIQ
jgi:hypothetical protein